LATSIFSKTAAHLFQKSLQSHAEIKLVHPKRPLIVDAKDLSHHIPLRHRGTAISRSRNCQ